VTKSTWQSAFEHPDNLRLQLFYFWGYINVPSHPASIFHITIYHFPMRRACANDSRPGVGG
jgi:hypothetical protein